MVMRHLAVVVLLVTLTIAVRAQTPSSYDELRRDARTASDQVRGNAYSNPQQDQSRSSRQRRRGLGLPRHFFHKNQ